MTLGNKLSKLRKENNYTQEQLAGILGVSRQAISKWESDTAYPETDKLIRIGELFDCSMDYLLRDAVETEQKIQTEEPPLISFSGRIFRERKVEKKSEKTLWGMPLWHIGKHAKGVVAVGLDARGIIAIGLKAKGLVSIGVLAMGVLSFGTLSLGLIGVGLLALGFLSVGCFSLGIFTVGAICLGIVSLGAVAIGDFSVGALAVGKYFAIGDHAKAMIAIGGTKAVGSVYEKTGKLTAQDIIVVKELLDATVPAYLAWIKDFVKLFL